MEIIILPRYFSCTIRILIEKYIAITNTKIENVTKNTFYFMQNQGQLLHAAQLTYKKNKLEQSTYIFYSH